MTIALSPIAELDPVLVLENLATLTQLLQEEEPTLDTRLGPLRDLILYNSAVFSAQRQQQINDYLRARSLLEINQDPVLADDDAVDAVLANYRLTRRAGTFATGSVTIVVSTNTTVTIAQGAVFTANGLSFLADNTYTAKTAEAQVIAENDRLLTSTPSAQYAFEINVTAQAEGAASNLARGVAMTPVVVPPNFVAAYVTASLSGGTATETNAELVGRLMQGAAANTISNRSTMAAFLRALPEFSAVVTSSIIGCGDAEMRRDKHWLWPIGGGGRVDWYVRTTERLTSTMWTVDAVLVEKTDDGFGLWQFGIARDDAPGFYEVESVVPEGATDADSYEITGDFRAVNMSSVGTDYLLPDVNDAVEGVYSRFQTSVIQFKDTDTLTTALAIGDHRSYDVSVRGLPLLAEIQDTVANRDHASYGADALVRAPIPCFVGLLVVLYQPSNMAAPDEDAIKDALCAVVNRTGFTGQLFASALAAAVQNTAVAGITAGSINMTGRLRQPNGDEVNLSSAEVLDVPDDPANTVTRRTVQFFAAPTDVTLTVTVVAPAST